jgi:antitoxin PrlF
MSTSKLSTKGQLVVPKQVRDFLRVRPGDRIDFVIRDDGQVLIRPAVLDIRDLRGAFATPRRVPVSLEEMDAAVRTRGGAR